jgi:hypothetical protein
VAVYFISIQNRETVKTPESMTFEEAGHTFSDYSYSVPSSQWNILRRNW